MGTLMRNRQVVGGTPVVDTALDSQSTDVVQNKVVAEAISTINSTLPQKKTISATTDANGFFTLPTANETPIGIKNVKFDGVTTQAKYEFMWNTNNTYAIKLMTWNNQTHQNKNVTLDLIYVVV